LFYTPRNDEAVTKKFVVVKVNGMPLDNVYVNINK